MVEMCSSERFPAGIVSPQQEHFLYYKLFTAAQSVRCYQLITKSYLLNEDMD